MYAETGLLYPTFYHSFAQEVQSFEELCGIQKPNCGSMSNLVPPSTVLEYSLGEEGDLFKAPEPIIEEPAVTFDPIASAISMISCGEDVISTESMNITDMGSMQNDSSILSEVFYECKKDLLENSAIKELFPEVPSIQMEDDSNLEKNMLVSQGSIYKSVSSGCLSSMEWISGNAARPNFLDFQGVDFGTAYGMRRAYSEGDMQTLGSGNNTNLIHLPFERTLSIGNSATEDRLQKLSRYRKKKTKRNFGRTIKYACRKALADSQPRVRGRFAKTDEFTTTTTILE